MHRNVCIIIKTLIMVFFDPLMILIMFICYFFQFKNFLLALSNCGFIWKHSTDKNNLDMKQRILFDEKYLIMLYGRQAFPLIPEGYS